MKKCSKCKVDKEESEFYSNSKRPDNLQSFCKDCNRKYNATRYNNNKEYLSNKNKELLKRNQEFIIDYLKSHPCVDCGESDLVVLEFDHVTGDKLDAVTRLVSTRSSIDKIKEEILKCEVRCCNCHRRKTAKSFNYYRLG